MAEGYVAVASVGHEAADGLDLSVYYQRKLLDRVKTHIKHRGAKCPAFGCKKDV